MSLPPHMLRPQASGLGFDPRSIAGLEMYLNAKVASSITLNGSNVSEWRDLSGKNRHATQGTGANQPAYSATSWSGRPSITFTKGSSHFLGFTPFALTTQTVFFVVEPTDNMAGSLMGIYTGSNGQSNRYHFAQAAGYTGWSVSLGAGTSGTPNAVGADIFEQAKMLISHTYNGGQTSTAANHGIRKNRDVVTPVASGAFGVFSSASARIGHGRPNISADHVSARFGVILLYNRVLSAAEITAVENWAVSEYPLT